MEIFEPFRAIGYIPSSVPFSVQRLGTETLQQIYNCAKPNLVLVGPQLPKKIRYRDYTFAAYGNLIAVFKRSQQVATWSAHNSKVILLLQFGEYILSVDVDGNFYTWAFNGIEQNLTHPDTYLNKVVSGSEEGSLQLWNVSSKKKLYDFRRWQLPIHCYVSSAALDVVLMSSSTDNSIKEEEVKLKPLIAVMDTLLVSVGYHGDIKMWMFDTSDGEPRILRFCSAPPPCIRFYTNRRDILSPRQDRASRLFSDVQFEDARAGIHGTTVVALRYKEGLIIGADSRGSNETTIMEKKAKNELPIPNLKIKDNWMKQYEINHKILCVKVGDRKSSIAMQRVMVKQCKKMTHKTGVPYGVVIAGSGSKGDPPALYAAYIKFDEKDKKFKVMTEEGFEFFSIGSGKNFAVKRANDEIKGKFKYSMSFESCEEYVLRCCFAGTYFDRQSGGPICLYNVRVDGWMPISVNDILDRYWKDYDEKLNRKTLFLLIKFETANLYPMIGDELREYFSREFGRLPTHAHRVCRILIDDEIGWNFHRLLFDLDEEAKTVIDGVKKIAVPLSSTNKTPVLDFLGNFYKIRFEDKCFYLSEASKLLVGEMMNIRRRKEPHDAYEDAV